LSEELILWSSQEFGFVTLPDAYTTGSSMMPQKKNPDVCELVRGKTGRVYGALMGILTVMKGLPLAYNKDMQEDKQGLFDALDTAEDSLRLYVGMLPRADFHAPRMRAAAESGFSNATDLADYLVRRGVPFREAHHVVGRLVALALDEGVGLADLGRRARRRGRRAGAGRRPAQRPGRARGAQARERGRRARRPRRHGHGARSRGDRRRQGGAGSWRLRRSRRRRRRQGPR